MQTPLQWYYQCIFNFFGILLVNFFFWSGEGEEGASFFVLNFLSFNVIEKINCPERYMKQII
jgi:hypothetical protein